MQLSPRDGLDLQAGSSIVAPGLADPTRCSVYTMKGAAAVLAAFLFLQISSAQAFAYQRVFEQAGSYTVKIKTTIRHAFAGDRAGTRHGAGFLVDRELGLIVTNAHVSGKSPAAIRVGFRGKTYVNARPVYIDPELDLAFLKVHANHLPSWATAAKLDCSRGRLVGRQVATFGHPKGLAFSATMGIVSRVAFGWGRHYIQTDLPTNPGNSGGALIDLKNSKVIGVHAASYRKTQGIALAVPSWHLCKILSFVKQGRNPSPPDLGLDFATDRNRGSSLNIVGGRIPAVFDNLRIGDRIISANGTKLWNPTDLSTALRGVEGQAEFQVERDGKRLAVQVPVRPIPLITDRKGLLVDGALFSEDVYAQRKSAENLLSVHSVNFGSRAEAKGIRRYYRLLMSNSRRIETLEDLERHFLSTERDGQYRMVFRKSSSAQNTVYDHIMINLAAPKIRWIAFPKNYETKVTNLREQSRSVSTE